MPLANSIFEKPFLPPASYLYFSIKQHYLQ